MQNKKHASALLAA